MDRCYKNHRIALWHKELSLRLQGFFKDQQADRTCICIMHRLHLVTACRLDWRSASKNLMFVFIQAGVVSLHSTMLPFMVTVHWLTFSLVMELTPTWSVMRDRQPFILVAGEQQFKVLISWWACLFSLFRYVTVPSSSVSALHLVLRTNRLYFWFISGKETSTSCVKWCSMELICVS